MSFEFTSEDVKCCDREGSLLGETDDAMQLDIVDHLCCKICYEPYVESGDKEPRVMKCGHSICFQCISFISSKKRTLLCPFCNCADRHHHARPNTLPKNYDIISMIPHYPNLPANHKPCNVELEKLKAKWSAQQTSVAHLKLCSEQAGELVKQATEHLEHLKRHANVALTQLEQAEGAMKASEETMRIFIDAHPDDPMMMALAELLPKSPVVKAISLLESIRQAKSDKSSHSGASRASSRNTCSSRGASHESVMRDLMRTSANVVQQPPCPRGIPPPAPPQPHAGRGADSQRPRNDPSSFANSIASAAARMHLLNNPESVEERNDEQHLVAPSRVASSAPPPPVQPLPVPTVLSRRQQMLNMWRGIVPTAGN